MIVFSDIQHIITKFQKILKRTDWIFAYKKLFQQAL